MEHVGDGVDGVNTPDINAIGRRNSNMSLSQLSSIERLHAGRRSSIGVINNSELLPYGGRQSSMAGSAMIKGNERARSSINVTSDMSRPTQALAAFHSSGPRFSV